MAGIDITVRGLHRDSWGTSRHRSTSSRESYREQAEILAEEGVDLLLLEMLRDVERAGVIVEAALATGIPVWSGLSSMVEPGKPVMALSEYSTVEGLTFEEVLDGGEVPGWRHGNCHALGGGVHSALARSNEREVGRAYWGIRALGVLEPSELELRCRYLP